MAGQMTDSFLGISRRRYAERECVRIVDHQTIQMEPDENETGISSAKSIEEDQRGPMTEREQSTNGPTPLPRIHDDGPDGSDALSTTALINSCTSHLERELEESERGFQARPPGCTIFRIPEDLRGISTKAEKPEIVSIGPYHRRDKRLLEFKEQKRFFLRSFLRRTESKPEDLVKLVVAQERSARNCYSEKVDMSEEDFVNLMVLDGCFVVELLLDVLRSYSAIDKDNPLHARPNIIPILIRDLLKLENQVPYPLLESLFNLSRSTRIEAKTPFLCMLALRVFNQVYPRSALDMYTDVQYRRYNEIKNRRYKHLLDLFNFALFPTRPVHQECQQQYQPTDHSIRRVTQLRTSGIKFKSKQTESFLDISLQKQVLQIPSIVMDEFMITVLINCTALEQFQENSTKYITGYVFFMYSLIKEPDDISCLRSNGIISTLSYGDYSVVRMFDQLGKDVVFYACDSHLSKQFNELDSYYFSFWGKMKRDYYSYKPWSVMSVLLVLALTITQTIYAVLGYHFR